MDRSWLVVLTVLVALSSVAAHAQPGACADDWESLKSHPVPAWLDDAKVGIFIHWGPCSVAGYTPSGRGLRIGLARK